MKYLFVLILIICCGAAISGQTGILKTDRDPTAGTAIYIPADKRHQGLSLYDLIPFTDREKGDPDRYRAVNPKFVKRENGRYFYALTIKPGTHFYDDNLKDKGALSDTNVEVDLTRTKTAATQPAGGENLKYVFVKDKGYVLISAIEQTVEDIRAGRWFYFPIKPGEYAVYDGTGIKRGILAARSVRLNYGLQKEIGGEIYYYAFSTQMKSLDETLGVSGWIKASAVEAGNDPQFDPEFVGKMQMPTAANDRFTRYEITGGEPQEKTAEAAKGAGTGYKFGYAGKNGEFNAYKVLPKIPLGGKQSVAATDYLKRSDDVINLGFNPAGVSNDTFRVTGRNRPLIFYRSAERDATVEIDLFYAKDDTHDGEQPAGKMTFVYGYVAVPNGKRWGWIPLGALRITDK